MEKFGKLIRPRQTSAHNVSGLRVNCANEDSKTSDVDSVIDCCGDVSTCKYIYIYGIKVAALLDTGSTVDIISNSIFLYFKVCQLNVNQLSNHV